ncbi:putative phage baseplate assembly protein [Kribbella amoyensis]|uniref:Putative phage baseplate assembly protein n=1 Tax=Kribbella amoyensis TaxID=996641 RepID=A0A561BKH6_9ACTN|nr:putative baseplate assembly protein [Kribbella amoyensis]TWD79387.1 putative phage baseplate assembly protein [Kribbella amoyensis]
MALPAPDLDARRYDDLVADAVQLVRRSCPGWTDESPSDVGITLLEAYAFLTDGLFRRLNQVPDRLRLKFFDLIGLRLVPPTPATVPVTFWLSAPARSPLVVAQGTEVGTVRTEAEPSVVFSTTTELTIPPSSVAALLTRTVDDPDPVPHDAEVFSAFSDPPMPGDEVLIGLTGAVPSVAIQLDYAGQTQGLGVDPENPPLCWEAWTGAEWTRCDLGRDGTGGLNRSGSVVLHVPPGHQVSVIGGRPAGWLRGRVVETGEGRTPYTAPPQVQRLEVSSVGGTVDAVQAELVHDEVLGLSEGVPGQVFTVRFAPVLGGLGDPVVEVGSDDGWQQWTAVDDFAAGGPDDRYFRLDAVPGEIAFAPVVRLPDGGLRRYGAVPAKGQTIRVRGYATGGGARGNVPAAAIATLKSSIPFVSAVENRAAAHGGTDGETVDEAAGRAPIMLRTRGRAVTAEDYEALAREAVPEAARIRCITGGDDATPAGTVRVLVVPSAAQQDGVIDFADLVPPEPLLERLAERLDQVRLIGTRVSVEPPRYRGITVVARLVARPRVDHDRVRRDALTALHRFLSPLPGGGPGGSGWEFGRPVRSGDVYAVLQDVRGVQAVEDVRLFSANPVTGERGAEQTRIELERNSLVFSFEHLVKVEDH